MTTVAIIGAGLLGRGIAAVVARCGYPVVLHDANAATLSSALEYITAAAHATGSSIRVEHDLEAAVREADLVIEAVIEDLALKQRLFERMGCANTNAVLMSNSSVLPIGNIALQTPRPERTVGTHWWNPPHLIPVVEVIRGPETSESTLQCATGFLKTLGKIPVRVERDLPGFVGNRLQHALWREALALVSQRVRTPEEVDRITAASLGQSLARRGPFAEMNRVGRAELTRQFESTLPLINSDPHPAKALRDNVSRNLLGAKTGQGFFYWPDDARDRAARRLQQHVERRLARQAVPPCHHLLSADDKVIAQRLYVALWREALALVEDGVSDAATVDLMAESTIGLRLAVMGPIENADYVGLDLTLAIHEAVLPSLNASIDMPASFVGAVRTGESL